MVDNKVLIKYIKIVSVREKIVWLLLFKLKFKINHVEQPASQPVLLNRVLLCFCLRPCLLQFLLDN